VLFFLLTYTRRIGQTPSGFYDHIRFDNKGLAQRTARPFLQIIGMTPYAFYLGAVVAEKCTLFIYQSSFFKEMYFSYSVYVINKHHDKKH